MPYDVLELPLLLTADEAAALLRMTRKAIYIMAGRRRSTIEATAGRSRIQDGQQRAGRAERAAQESGGMGRDRSNALRNSAAAGSEAVRRLFRL